MFEKKIPVLYKKQCAIVEEIDSEKIVIKYQVSPATESGKKAVYAQQKVREKDIVALSKTAASSLEDILSYNDSELENQIKETYELLTSDESSAQEALTFEELCSILRTNTSSNQCWFIFKSLCESLEFNFCENELKNGLIKFVPRKQEEILAIKKKNFEKEHEEEIRKAFIERLKQRKLLPEDSKFMVEVENLALGKSEKSKVMVEAGITQTPEKAHQLLIDCGIWNITKNPYPARYGLSMNSASQALGLPPEEERIEVPTYAYAIDNKWSTDPDDAVAFDGKYLWVHIADPASYVKPDSSIDKVARNKGTTLYLPEGAVRMLNESCFEEYALGIKEKSRALSFRILLNEENSIDECRVFKTFVNVKRMTYEEATNQKETAELAPLFEIAKKNIERRKKSGAISINMPEVHISVNPETKKVELLPLERFEADDMVCEMMLLAGEGAARFAMNNRIPFPYVTQDAPDIPKTTVEGLAGQFALLKCMHKRSVGITPGMHAGLGLATYSQVTSPLRRYSDLIAHQQLRAFLNGEKLLDKDTMLERISQGDAASIAARKASRFSEIHWKLIYLLQNPQWSGKGICIDIKNGDSLIMIPSLAMQTTLAGTKLELNQEVMLKPTLIDIPTQKCVFSAV